MSVVDSNPTNEEVFFLLESFEYYPYVDIIRSRKKSPEDIESLKRWDFLRWWKIIYTTAIQLGSPDTIFRLLTKEQITVAKKRFSTDVFLGRFLMFLSIFSGLPIPYFIFFCLPLHREWLGYRNLLRKRDTRDESSNELFNDNDLKTIMISINMRTQ